MVHLERAFLSLLVALLLPTTKADSAPPYTPPPNSPGFYHGNSTASVTFDQHSLFLDDKRIFVFSGEFHPWRSPTGPPAWRDVLEKMKAAGFNSVSVYHHWGLTEQKQGQLSFDYYRSQSDFYQVAKEVGILVMARPGPYINAETGGGGFPGWSTNIAAKARTNATEFTNAWKSYIAGAAKSAAPYQYPDGPVILVQSENEFFPSSPGDPGRSEYMVLIEDTLRDNGITKVPLTHNDAGTNGRFAEGLGKVDWYMWDNYPNNFLCSMPDIWNDVSTTLNQAHLRINPAEPWAAGEFQGGSFDPWGGSGYDKCYQLTNEQFANVFYKNNYAAGTVYQNLYMTYGGTNWGNLAEPTVYSSYDYGAPIREDRSLSPKYSEIKLQAHFLHASPDLLVSRPVSQGTNFTNNPLVFTTDLTGDLGTHFYVVRQATNQNTNRVEFSLNINTRAGNLTVPQHGGSISLDGRESKIIVSNYKFGSSELQYSTAEIFTWMTIDKVDYVILYALEGQSIEAVLVNNKSKSGHVRGSSTIKVKRLDNSVVITGKPSGVSYVSVGSTTVIVADKKTSLSFWAPRTDASESPYEAGPGASSILVSGPYFVRSASVSGSTLALRGDLNATTTLEALAPASVKHVTWNGKPVVVTRTQAGTLSGQVAYTLKTPRLPRLEGLSWSCVDSLPEIQPTFNDKDWVDANKTITLRPPEHQPLNGKVVLYADEYGFHAGNTLYRGHFKGKSATGVSLTVQGGFNFGYSAWINSHFLFSNNGTNQYSANGGTDLTNDTLTFHPNSLNDGDNVLTVLLDPTGLEEDFDGNESYKTPRGIRGYELHGSEFDNWKIIGNFGGEDGPDKVRGVMNEGGLFVERIGAHLPGFPAKQAGWLSDDSCNPLKEGISQAGIKAYRTTFELNLPVGSDIPLALKFTRTPSSRYRSVIFINGWQFGRFSSADGPQTIFPLPDGILNSRGKNELLITLWSLDANGAKFENIEFIATAAIESTKAQVPGGIVKGPSFQELR